ncbi:MAG: hypothetical protein U9R08_06135 [Nanoarchaeota archaeon]|nr:hypothetical protein [Nanoarchaeota archaeon]
MALKSKAAAAVLLGIAGLVASATTDHFEPGEWTAPFKVAEKMKYDQGVQYCVGYGTFMGALAGLGYLAATGKMFKNSDE